MNFLQNTIDLLEKQDHEQFKNFLRDKNEVRNLQLFELLTAKKKHDSITIANKLYQPRNLNAYHTLRKRLMEFLMQFISLKGMQLKSTSGENISRLIAISEFMLDNAEPEMASHFLNKAEKLAVREDKIELLDIIYHLNIANADRLKKNLDIVIKLWKSNRERLQLKQQLDVAFAIIKKKLAEARKTGTILDPDDTISAVFREFNISSEAANNASFMYKIVAMTRSAIVSSKDYYRIEGSTLRIYWRLKNSNAFGKKDSKYELGFVYMIAHVLYRNRKFDEASEWAEKMNKVLPSKEFLTSPYYSKYIMLRAAIDTFSWKNAKAIAMISKALQDGSLKFDLEERLNMQLNLVVNYFQAEDYKKANSLLYEIGHTDLWLEKKMGKEWRFKKNMIEIIVQCELKNDDIALKKIKAIENTFGEFLSHPSYARARMFLKFIRKVITEPWMVTTPEFAEQVKEARMGLPQDKEDIQAITFFCWLKSKMLGRKYYEVLVETIRDRA